MSLPEIQITSIAFEPNGLLITYMAATDVRVQGNLSQQHQIFLNSAHPDYREDTQLLHDRAVKALRNALEDFESSEPYSPESDDDEEDTGLGM